MEGTGAMNDESKGVKRFERVWVVGFAGHRVLADEGMVRAAIRRVLEAFVAGVDGQVVGRSSAAAGADLIFLEECEALGLETSVVLPMAVERFREDFTGEMEWARAERLLQRARDLEVLPGVEGVPEVYHLAAREILDVSDFMVFVWDGEAPRGIGGTGESVHEARERGMSHCVIDAKSGMEGPMVGGRGLPWKDPVFDGLPKVGGVKEMFVELDRRAVSGAPRSRWFSAGSITFNQMATVVHAILVGLGLGLEAAPAIKFLMVTVAAFLPWVGARIRIHDGWVEDRIRAELLRSLMVSHAFAPPLGTFAADLFLKDAPFLKSAAWRMLEERRSWEEERERYLKERLDGQIGYLRSKGDVAAKRLRILEVVFRCSSYSAMVLGAVAILNGLLRWQVGGWVERVVLTFIPSVLPAVAAWCLAMISLFEYKRRAGLYRQLVDRLRVKRAELAEARSRTTAAVVVGACERLLLTELWEWSGTRGKRR